MKQVTTKRTIMNIIDNHLFSSMSAIPSKRNSAAAPPMSAKAKRIQKSVLVRFLIMFCCSSDTTESVEVSINADHATDEIEFRLRRSIAGTEDLIFLYAENDWSTEELERQLLEKIDKLMLLYLENEWDMLELEKKLADLDRQLEAL